MAGADLIVSLLKVGAVLVLLILALRLLARYQRGQGGARRTAGRAPASVLEVVDQTRLGRTASAVAVRAGDRILLLGVSEAGVSHLADVTEDVDLSEPEVEDEHTSVLDHALDLLKTGSLKP